MKRWICAAKLIPAKICDTLKSLPTIKPGYVLTNDYFVATGVNGHNRLGTEYALEAVAMLAEEAQEDENGGPAMTIKQFISEVCAALKLLELWANK